MIFLLNNCRRSKFTIFPANWKSPKAKLKPDWYIDCRFIDPSKLHEFPKGKVIRLKAGINRLKHRKERKQVVNLLIENMTQYLNDGYNPITNAEFNIQQPNHIPITEVLPTSLFIPALKFALSKSQNVKESIADITSVLKSFETAAKTLEFDSMQIGDIQVKHIKMCLDECCRANLKFSAKRFNKSKAYLSGLFKYLIQLGAAYGNMALAVSPMREVATKQVYLTDTEVEQIKKHLYKYNRPFLKFVMIFFYSGGRLKEMFRLQVKDVDLIKQMYSSIVKKGKERWVDRTIRNVALPYWKEQLQCANPNDYVFSKNLLPGPDMINSKQVSRRWTTHVQKPLGITAGIYKLKHRNADKTLEAAGALMTAKQLGHTTTKMAEQVYAYNERLRIHEGLKELDIDL